MKILVEIILHIRKEHFNLLELIKHIDMILIIFNLNKLKWLEILLMLFKIDVKKDNFQNLLEAILDKILDSKKQEDLSH